MLRYCYKAVVRVTCNIIQQNVRLISSSGQRFLPGSYEGDGKTTVNILNSAEDMGLMINGVSQVGFRLNNGFTVLGPIVIFPRSVLAWNVASVNDITPETLSLFTVLEPKLEIVVLGTGDKLEDQSFYKKILPFMRKHRLNVEVLPTETACPTFNFLNCEGRYVAGALIPPPTLTASDDDLLRSKLRYQNLYEMDLLAEVTRTSYH